MAPRWKQDFPVPSPEDSYVTRREFTKFMGLTSLAFLIGTCVTAGRTLIRRFRSAGADAVPIAHIDDVPVGGYKLFRYPTENDPCILVRLDQDRFVAYDQRCTHLSCPVVFNAQTKQLACPCHRGFFGTEDGRALAGPPKRGLTPLAVSTHSARVWVRTPPEHAA